MAKRKQTLTERCRPGARWCPACQAVDQAVVEEFAMVVCAGFTDGEIEFLFTVSTVAMLPR